MLFLIAGAVLSSCLDRRWLQRTCGVVVCFGALLGAELLATDAAMSLWFDSPGASFLESSVVGNGRLGAMDLGGVEKQRIVLNESTLWSGGPYEANRADAHKCLPEVQRLMFAGEISKVEHILSGGFSYPDGVKGWFDQDQFGCYQTLGDLTIVSDLGGHPQIKVTSPSGHEAGDGKTIALSIDGQAQTKWCVTGINSPVQWQASLPKLSTVASYRLTSGDDMPARDPQSWTLEGSADGQVWQELDRRDEPPMTQRGEIKVYTIAKPGAYQHYRFTFQLKSDSFQVAEIELEGVKLAPESIKVTDYRRELNLRTGLATTRFVCGGVTFTRELLASKPDEALVLRLRADRPGALSFRAQLSRQRQAQVRAEADGIVMEGQMPFHSPTGNGEGVKYQARLGVLASGGETDCGANGWQVRGADEALLVVAAVTNLREAGAMDRVRQQVEHALKQPFTTLKTAAIADHQRYMDRCSLTLPSQNATANLPTPQRVKCQEKQPDPALAALYFQFGRYLVVAGSRPDSPLPTNLQGIWAEEYSTPWRGDFHTNINLQMNYWPVDVTNLSDCHAPLNRFLEGMAREGAKTAKAYFNAPGWVAYHTQNPWFETVPSFLPASAGPTCGAWLAQHLWSHYQFTQDRAFLQQYYPILRGAAEFAAAVLVEDPKTKHLVTIPSSSPENHYAFINAQGQRQVTWLCVGSTIDMQIFRGLFESTAAAARELGIDAEFAKKLDQARARLAPTQVNSSGRIMEWLEDYEEVEVHHRHSSHLWGLYPGTEIKASVPALFQGARASLERRGDESTGWSMAWKANFWARLKDGDRAEHLLSLLIGRGAGNFFCLHPPFQIDGNFGGCAAVAEMLMQSHDGAIELLPALPKHWAVEGAVTGLKARGNVTVSFRWKEGKVTDFSLTGVKPSQVKVRLNGEEKMVQVSAAH